MDKKKMLTYLLGATLMVQATTMAQSSEPHEKKVLTLAHAIKQASDKSIQLRMNERESGLAKENAEMARLIGGYYAYDAQKVQYEYTKKQQAITKDEVTLSVTSLYEDILLHTKQLELFQCQLELLEKEKLKSEIKHNKGLESELHKQQNALRHKQVLQSINELTQGIQLKYIQLENKLGTTIQNHVLEPIELIYEPYKEVERIDRFIKNKAQEHLTLWKATEDLRVAQDTPIMTSDYIQFITLRAQREAAQDAQKLTQQNLEMAIRQVYMHTRQLEQQYTYLEADLALKEKQLAVNAIYLEKGMVSPLRYEQDKLAYQEAKLKLQQLITTHNRYKFQLEHPNLISATGLSL